MSGYGPSLADVAEANYTCFDEEVTEGLFTQSCPPLLLCYDNGTGTEKCHCGNQVLASNWPYCDEKSSSSWMPIISVVLVNIFCFYNVVWGIWMITRLKILGQLSVNAVTKALGFCTLSAVACLINQLVVFISMIVQSEQIHVAYMAPGLGINSITLALFGFGVVLCYLSIPLLWIDISSAGMNRAESAKRKERSEKIVKFVSVGFVTSFVAFAAVMGVPNTGIYCIFWLFILTVVFNYGGRSMTKQMRSSGDKMKDQALAITKFVYSFTFGLFSYVLTLGWMFTAGNDPGAFWLPTLLVYATLAAFPNFALRYVQASLAKKLKKIKKGVVVASSTSSTSSTEVVTSGVE